MSPPLSVSPEAAFIAASAASQIVTNDHDSHADTWYDQHGIEPSSEPILVSPAALQLVNNFLDQLLFNFLSVARSTNLSALRPAVSEVLKPKLAKDAVNQADDELREYLGGGDDEITADPEAQSARDWDLELEWKRTRLRCMVYSSLGDMEEEDEDYYMEQENLDTSLGDRQAGAVSASVSIFLTSILEYLAEAALVIAGQAAYHRMQVRYEKEIKEGIRSSVDVAERLVIQELDMERVALDRTLGRLWRAWKKKIRSPGLTSEGSFSRLSAQHMRKASFNFNEATVPPTVPEPETEAEVKETPIQGPMEEYLFAASIPLPMRDNDVDEIEVPGLCSFRDDDEEDSEIRPAFKSARPKSLMILPHRVPADLPTPTSQPNTPVATSRKRSNSVPTPAASPLSAKRQKIEAVVVELPEGSDKTAEEDCAEDSSKEVPRAELTQHTDQAVQAGTLAVPTLSPAEKTHRRVASSESVVINTAAAVEVATVAGFKAQAEAEAEAEQDVTDIEEDHQEEEPQVLTSRRISVSGRSVSPTTSEPSKRVSVSLRPVRTLSVHSLRLIEVAGPRSPSTRSRGSSVDATEMIRAGNLSRTNSISTTPIVEEYRGLEPPATARTATSILSSESVSEAEEIAAEDRAISPLVRENEEGDAQDLATPTVQVRSPAQVEQVESHAASTQPIFGSARRKAPLASPRLASTPETVATTDVSPSSPHTNGGTFFFDDAKPDVPEKPSVHTRAVTQSPSVPPRSAGRPTMSGRQWSGLKVQTGSESSTVGPPSVQAQVEYRTRGETPSARTPDPPTKRLHTSASSVSSANTINNTPKFKPTRTSEEDVVKNFEELIQSDETIQYTLTPQSMRDDVRRFPLTPTPAAVKRHMFRSSTNTSPQPFNGVSPVASGKPRRSEDAYRAADRSRSSSVVNQANQQHRPGSTRSGSVSRVTGLNSHPVTPSGYDVGQTANRANVTAPRSAPQASPKDRAKGPQARDPRLPRESLADFAEFIRSTGPAGEPAAAPSTSGNAFTRAAGQSAPVRPAGPVSVASGLTKASTSSSRTNLGRPRLQARDAAVDKTEDNSDLIDFIRQGPPSAVDAHRIPRAVAPFRTTMDSDQMSGAVGGKAVDATIQVRDMNEVRGSQASTTVTDYSMPSVQSSINSQTGLLRKQGANVQGPAYGGAANDSNTFDDMPIPKRKTRRVRDPYAIDLSDEEDDMLEDVEATPKAASRRPPPKEESLADFLRNYTPPPEPVRAPVAPASQPKKKASAPSLMARFTSRRGSVSTSGSQGNFKLPPPVPQTHSTRPVASRAGSVASARTSGTGRHVPIQVSMPPGADRYNPGYGAVPPSSGVGSRPPVSMHNGSRVSMKRFEPKEPAAAPTRSATSDLADFLRNSGPPPGTVVQDPYPMPQNDAKSGFFGRRKKASFT